MKLVKVAAAVLNQTPRDWEGNKSRILKAIRYAHKEKASILCLPELCITGYGLEDDFFCSDISHRAMLKLKEIAQTVSFYPLIFCVGLPIRFNNSLYNAVATIINGNIIGFTCKQHLAGDGIHYENRWFKPWPQGVVQEIFVPELVGQKSLLPIGDIHFDIDGIKIGYEICEDAWVAGRPGTILSTKGVDIYLNPSASHFSFGKLETRKNFVVDGSRAFNATYIYTNLLGNEAGRTIYDGGSIIASGGKLLAVGKRLGFEDVYLTTSIIDIDTTRTQSVRTASFQPDPEKYNQGCIKAYFDFPKVTDKIQEMKQESWETSKDIKHEECIRALGLSLMDYMRKSHTKGFVISLSGGADSAMVTYLCAMGIKLGINELGLTEFVNKYCPHLLEAKEQMDVEYIIGKLITTAYQSTAQSGLVTENAAKTLANALKTKHYMWTVEPNVQQYMRIGSQIKRRELNFKDDDIVLQNLQARSRSPAIWMVANMEEKLLLTTSNMSEAAVGYATMDGDTSGCVAPIAGLPKVYIRQFLGWVTDFGPIGIGPTKEMFHIITQQPTAELRPTTDSYQQTDEDDLMSYELLHRIETLVVKNRYIPLEIYEELKATTSWDNNYLINNIVKFFRLFSRNQWKRERYALSFHMDDHNLDPRTWCRTPILTGGYEEELKELKNQLQK